MHGGDASRTVNIVNSLLSEERSAEYKKELKKEYDEFREKFLARQTDKEYVSIEEAREKKFKIDWENETIIKPKKLGITVIENQDFRELLPFVDWSPFFRSWDLHGRFPNILEDEKVTFVAGVFIVQNKFFLLMITRFITVSFLLSLISLVSQVNIT